VRQNEVGDSKSELARRALGECRVPDVFLPPSVATLRPLAAANHQVRRVAVPSRRYVLAWDDCCALTRVSLLLILSKSLQWDDVATHGRHWGAKAT